MVKEWGAFIPQRFFIFHKSSQHLLAYAKRCRILDTHFFIFFSPPTVSLRQILDFIDTYRHFKKFKPLYHFVTVVDDGVNITAVENFSMKKCQIIILFINYAFYFAIK